MALCRFCYLSMWIPKPDSAERETNRLASVLGLMKPPGVGVVKPKLQYPWRALALFRCHTNSEAESAIRMAISGSASHLSVPKGSARLGQTGACQRVAPDCACFRPEKGIPMLWRGRNARLQPRRASFGKPDPQIRINNRFQENRFRFRFKSAIKARLQPGPASRCNGGSFETSAPSAAHCKIISGAGRLGVGTH